MNRPTAIQGGDSRALNFTARVTDNGQDWHIRVFDGDQWIASRFRSTLQARPDNGALEVTRLLRREYGITGTFKTNAGIDNG